MAHRLIVRRKAALDIESAVRWYEAERAGLGKEFVVEIDRILRLIVEAPLHYPAIYGHTRRALLDRFSFAVFFRVHAERVHVVAVFHTSRDPRSWHIREDRPVYEDALAA